MLDTMRLVDLILILLFDGRKALQKTNQALAGAAAAAAAGGASPGGGAAGGGGAGGGGLRRMDSAGERSHRQLIDCIRSKDTDALIDAVDNANIEVCIVPILFVYIMHFLYIYLSEYVMRIVPI